jgi:predicted dehydrogenase
MPAAVPHPLSAPPVEPRGVLGVLQNVVRAIRAGRPPETHARDNAASLAMVLAAIRSAENGGRREPVRRLGDLVDASGLPRRVPVREG